MLVRIILTVAVAIVAGGVSIFLIVAGALWVDEGKAEKKLRDDTDD